MIRSGNIAEMSGLKSQGAVAYEHLSLSCDSLPWQQPFLMDLAFQCHHGPENKQTKKKELAKKQLMTEYILQYLQVAVRNLPAAVST